ncbi:helix-turn-helix and ligand-binding sensor domain-containing protein [Portibacter marinus]|uniref:helix-turn-helix and ligand-binding sensor domain-containing protein n=1 Tax=Portibacter marinus TaxID=2898660 RepID=UPI001F481247|nr:two-component regulator propeller domain-containing protein [Portibacter marinus]
MKYFILGLTFFLSSVYCWSQEIPQIISFSPSEYNAHHQNWSITEGCDHNIYVANTDGVLIFNGLRWTLTKLPSNRRPRSVFRGSDCKVYVSGYESFGFIDISNPEQPIYKPVADSLLLGRNQEYWKIFGDSTRLMFQSFSEIFTYDYQHIKQLDNPGNIMLGTVADDEFILPKIESGVYQIKGDSIYEKVYQYTLPDGSKVVGVSEGQIYVTQNQGLFRRTEKGYEPIDSDLNDRLKTSQVNSFLKTSDDQYVIGTILNGIYITDDLKSIRYHIDQSKGLSNNTVLNLHEDSHGNLWVGLDRGLDLVKINQPLLYYYDQQGKLGSIFASITYKDRLYIGTNQGVFTKTIKGDFELIENSQGQVWSFIESDGDLLCGHNRGTFLIKDKAFKQVSSITGGWCMKKINTDKFIQSSYTGLVLFEKIAGQWSDGFRIEDGGLLIENFELIDHTLLGYHPHHGIVRVELSEDFKSVLSNKTIDHPFNNDPLILTQSGGFLLKTREDSLYIGIDEDKSGREDQNEYGKLVNKLNGLVPISNTRFNKPHGKSTDYLFNFSDGYLIAPYDYSPPEHDFLTIDYVLVNNSIRTIPDSRSLSLSPFENDILIQFRTFDVFSKDMDFKYKLEGWDDQWLPLPKDGQLVFKNLQDGAYRLELMGGNKPLTFKIAPRWYESWPGLIMYMVIAFLTILFFNQRQQLKLRKQKEKLDAERLKELESERIRAKNAELENEVIYKNKMLANSTMTLVQKNKMLIDLKATLSKELKSADAYKRRQILHLIEMNMNSEDDWELFEPTFAEVHEDFLDKLRGKHSNITQGELRLAAYIKMDLSSKEIAPLMNISVRSIENKRYRLRKKLGIEDQSLKSYLQAM